MDKKSNKEIDKIYKENLVTIPSIPPDFSSIIANQKILKDMKKVYSSAQSVQMISISQKAAKIFDNIEHFPAMKNTALLKQNFSDYIQNSLDPSIILSIDRMNQIISKSVLVGRNIPDLTALANFNQEIIVSMSHLYSSPEYKGLMESIQQAVRSAQKISIDIESSLFIDNAYLTDIANELYQSDTFTGAMKNHRKEEISIEDVDDVLKQEITVSEYKTLEDKIGALSRQMIESERITKKDIILLLLPILFLPIFQPFFDVYNEWAQIPAKKIIKIIKQEIINTNKPGMYSKVRIVKKNELKIKRANRRNSETIGELGMGEMVDILYKNRNWTQIKITKNNTTMEGWVYTRYLQKIN